MHLLAHPRAGAPGALFPTLRTLIALLLAGGVAGSPCAHAEGRAGRRSVALLGVSGPHGDELAVRLGARLAEKYKMVDGSVYRSQAEEMDKRGASPEEVSAVCRKLVLDALVAGAVKGGAARLLRVVVRDGGSGDVVARLDEPLGADGSLSIDGEDRLVQAAVQALDAVAGVPRPGRARLADRERDGGGEKVARRANRSRSPQSVRLDDDDPAEGDGGAEAEPDSEPAARPLATDDDHPGGSRPGGDDPTPAIGSGSLRRAVTPFRASPAVVIDAGFGLLQRTLSLSAPGSVNYVGGTVPAVRAEAILLPFAWTAEAARRNGALSWFGIAIGAVMALPFSSESTNADLIPASAHRWDAGLLIRIPLRAAGDYALKLDTGYLDLFYASSDPRRLDVPNVEHKLLREAVSVSLALGTPRVTLDVGGSISYLLDAGDIASISSFGGASGFGAEGEAALSVHATRWLLFKAQAHYAVVDLSFHGGGARVGSGALDRFFDAGIAVGYAVR